VPVCKPNAPASAYKKIYNVRVQFPKGALAHQAPICVQMAAPEHMPVKVPVSFVRSGTVNGAVIGATWKKVGHRCVCLELTLVQRKPGHHANHKKFSCTQTITLDTVTGVVLHGNSPEPCRVEVTVQPLKRSVAAPVMPNPVVVHPLLAPGMPMPHCGIPHPGCCPMPPPVMCYPPMMAMNNYIPEPMPVPLPMTPPPPPPVVANHPAVRNAVCVPASVKSRTSHIHLVQGCAKSRVCVESEGTATTGVRMTVKAGNVGEVTVAAGKKYVHISGKQWKASSDEIELRDDGHVILVGHVKVVSDKLGTETSVKSEKLCLEVRKGQFERIVTEKSSRQK